MDKIPLQLFQPLFLTKIVFLLFIFAYFVFSIVVLKQVQTMNRIVTESQSSVILHLLSVINLGAAFSLFLIALVIL